MPTKDNRKPITLLKTVTRKIDMRKTFGKFDHSLDVSPVDRSTNTWQKKVRALAREKNSK